ncbi:hypothetical protein AMAG_06611 [Allomyces macrogynus ATCC 38327]|uniref:Protein transport protein SEC22 n=1 Tax=Allomyces macrogynus (strain ATCC 38327) TaxID=578462 RepID=A0A0L0SEM4_ALLM3|nr:SNAP receptor [Allomyces javanicus]KAJ3368358.1 SNAP receptor [Allomyces arbusculus]KNE60845.1 hypothetical protein AMAG_06611 [Allomyces macrogynus ATCC 38327]|eukprot:KNE60845.1 hypothetical protein AMAG_06611 [Allomyces macrogynus ATCC 38327]
MVRSSMIARVADGLPLAASMDDAETEAQLRDVKNQAKQLFRKLSPNAEPRCSIESGAITLHYLIENDICYLVLCEKSYPRKLAFDYLSELAREFYAQFGHEVPAVTRPYAFVKFDTYIQKLKRQYQDSRNTAHLSRLHEDLQDVTRIMTKNMEDLLFRGDSLDKMAALSDNLRDSTRKYRKDARRVRYEALVRKHAPLAVVILVVLVVLYVKFWR